ncbi:MAG: hypothetical protein KBC44_01225 [Candidatus Pacebacteria bacterium]|nr:hypothetical protein [Candidatus Paceibacterota bacterium]MBP9839583.1 hypothetical protein [Candidatus Paceibacterota bacterium]
MNKQNILRLLRFSLGFIFLWAFLDKTFGLGFATTEAKAWINGGSPTHGFLSNAVKGPFADFFHSVASNPMIDWFFMAGLLIVGLTLIFNKYVKWGSYVGAAMMLVIWVSALPPENNPVIDDHIVYMFVFLYFALGGRD